MSFVGDNPFRQAFKEDYNNPAFGRSAFRETTQNRLFGRGRVPSGPAKGSDKAQIQYFEAIGHEAAQFGARACGEHLPATNKHTIGGTRTYLVQIGPMLRLRNPEALAPIGRFGRNTRARRIA